MYRFVSVFALQIRRIFDMPIERWVYLKAFRIT